MNIHKNFFKLDGKVALIAGSSRGIGFAFTESLKNQNVKVIGLSRKKNINPSLDIHYICDVTKQSNLELIKTICEKINIKLDIIIFAAGITNAHNSLNDKKNFINIINTNLVSNYNFINTFKPIMNKNASIINISSINAIQGFPQNPGYIASKGGVEALTRSLAVDLGKDKIRVNCIRPGYIKTDMTLNSFNNPKKNRSRKNKTILKRWGNTNDLVGPMLLLASDASSYMTGSIITVDGGWSSLGLEE